MYLVRKSIKERLLAKTIKLEGCWEFTGCRNADGYGVITERGIDDKLRPRLAHDVAYELFKGVIAEGLEVTHSCDNPWCVNPAHLFLQTHLENIQECHRKGRNANRTGERSGHNKLTEKDVTHIRAISEGSWTDAKVAKMYGVHRTLISGIRRGIKWPHSCGSNMAGHGTGITDSGPP